MIETRPTVSVKRVRGEPEVGRALKRLTGSRVLIGIPQAEAPRREPGRRSGLSTLRQNLGEPDINNAQLLYIHTHGSPLRGIPARPVIEPAIEASDNKASITGEMKQAAQAALHGKWQEARQFMRRAGIDAQSRVKAWFVDPRNHWAPNKPSTIARKGSDRPLIDTGQLRNAIVYVLEEGGKRQ